MTSSTGTFPVLDGRWYWPFPLKFQVIEKFWLDIANVHWTLSITTARPQLLSTGIAHRFCSPLLCIITKSCLVSSRWELPDATRAVTPWKPKLTRFQSSTCYCDFEWIFWKLYNELHNENLIMRSSLKRWCLWMAAIHRADAICKSKSKTDKVPREVPREVPFKILKNLWIQLLEWSDHRQIDHKLQC